ncbi:MAG: hypothetical protein JW776_14465 [Candidatus Lokiarchaeota archaeon]|nr:hypothetical protein [Candidatus Lokiarchaeota archaeon]
MTTEKKKIHVVFLGKPQWEAGWPYLGYDNDSFMRNVLSLLRQKFPHIIFTQDTIITTYDKGVIKTNWNYISQSDATLFFTIGHYGDPGLIKAGIELIQKSHTPKLLANFIYMGDHTFIKTYDSLKRKNVPILGVSSVNLEDFYGVLDILIKITEIKGQRALVYAIDKPALDWNRIMDLQSPELEKIVQIHPEFINHVQSMKNEEGSFFTDHKGEDQAHVWRKDEETYINLLHSIFGIEMIREDPAEILKYYDQIGDKEAESTCQMWIKNANITEPMEKTIQNAAKLYIALKKILTDKKCNFFAPDCGTLLLSGRLPAYPCMAFFELVNDEIYGICESDMDSLVSYVFGLTLTGRPGFVSNHTFDTIRNQVTYMHCVCSNKLFGVKGESSEYDIYYHGETAILGASPRVKFPLGENLTTIKISVFEKKIAIRTGRIIDNIIDDKGCVTKVLVETNVNKIMEKYDWETFGWHRVSFLGDWREKFTLGAKILGLQVIHEDQ